MEPSEDNSYIYYLVIYGAGSEKTEVYLQNLKEHGPIVPVVNDLNNLFWTAWAGNTLLLQTDWEAPQWHAYAVDPQKLSRENWREVVPESDIKMDVVTPAGGKLVATYMRNAATELKVFDWDGKASYTVPLPGLGTVQVSGRWGSPEIYYAYTSFNYAPTLFAYDVKTKASSVWAKSNVQLSPADFQVEQVSFKSKDGTKIPMFLFSKKGAQRKSETPVLLTAYGGFDVNITPDFEELAIVWAERGGILAVPNLRGGGEFGEEWHRAGMLEKKQNVFDDFIAAAEYLIAEKYTQPGKLAIEGASNGGLLVGAMHDAAPGPVPGGGVRLSAGRYATFPELSGGPLLGGGVWQRGERTAIPFHICVLAVSPREVRCEVSSRTLYHWRWRHSRGAPARTENGSPAASGNNLGSSDPAALRHSIRPLRRAPGKQTNRRRHRHIKLFVLAVKSGNQLTASAQLGRRRGASGDPAICAAAE